MNKKFYNRWWFVTISILLIALISGVLGFLALSTRVTVESDGNIISISLGSRAYADVVEPTAWGYKYTLTNGDVVEVGDSTTTEFKASVKTIRKGDESIYFSLELSGGSFTPTLNGLTVSFQYNDGIIVNIYPVDACERLPEGGIEYDIILLSRPTQSSVTFNIDYQGITWHKILPLNQEYDTAACEAEWGDTHTNFSLSETFITGENLETSEVEILKSIEMYEANSYLGVAVDNNHNTRVVGVNEETQQNITYSTVSRTYLYIHRGQMTDDLGDSVWIEDIDIDENKQTITFTLPRTWLRNATYPVHHVCGVDPSYTEKMESWYNISEDSWVDYDIFTENSVPKGAVAEIIITNDDVGKEYIGGVRTDGSSLNRYYTLHEAEGGGCTSGRMLALVDSSSGYVECFSDENTDIIFTLVGYWENVSFTETDTSEGSSLSVGEWATETLDAGADAVHFMAIYNFYEDEYSTLGVRETGSSLERKIMVHEQEAGGWEVFTLFVNADESYQIEIYSSRATYIGFMDLGYFGSELDFTELWQATSFYDESWGLVDLSAYLDQDGRVCDFLLAHNDESNPHYLGIRDGDETSMNRYIEEHNAESSGSTGEYTGFSMTAKSNSIGKVYSYNIYGYGLQMLTGYFVFGGPTPNISNTPSSIDYETGSTVHEDSDYWSSGSEPSFPLDDGECYFSVTNNSGAAVDIDVKGTNFSGGVGWTISSSTGENIVVLKVGKSGDSLEGDMVTLTTGDQSFITSLADSGTKKWEMKLETGTFTDGISKSSTVTLTASLSP